MSQPNSRSKPSSTRALLLGGLLPLLIYTLVEETFGIFWGLIAGMAFGIGEIAFELIRNGKVDPITWIGNLVLLILGGISLFTQEGIWFKLQPALIEFASAILLMGSVAIGKPFLILMAKKQNTFANLPGPVQPLVEKAFTGFTVRLGLFFLIHAAIAGWAAFYWTTRAWALLKGVGFTVTFLIYLVIEALMLRRRISTVAGFSRSLNRGA